MHLLDLLQTRIQVEIEYQNATQIQVMANRAATQLKIQRAVEGFSIIAISYYLLNLIKEVAETLEARRAARQPADHVGVNSDRDFRRVSRGAARQARFEDRAMTCSTT